MKPTNNITPDKQVAVKGRHAYRPAIIPFDECTIVIGNDNGFPIRCGARRSDPIHLSDDIVDDKQVPLESPPIAQEPKINSEDYDPDCYYCRNGYCHSHNKGAGAQCNCEPRKRRVFSSEHDTQCPLCEFSPPAQELAGERDEVTGDLVADLESPSTWEGIAPALLPCPWCKRKPTAPFYSDYGRRCFTRCFSTDEYPHTVIEFSVNQGLYESEEEVTQRLISMWNTRAATVTEAE